MAAPPLPPRSPSHGGGQAPQVEAESEADSYMPVRAQTPPALAPSPALLASLGSGVDTLPQESQTDKRRRIRTKIVSEIVSTEDSYVQSLGTLVDVYILQLTALSKHPEQPPRILSMEEINMLFSNIQMIYELNKKFLGDLQQRLENWTDSSLIGDLFVQFAHFFKMYTSYVNNHDTANKMLQSMLQDPKQALFQKFCEEANNDPRTGGTSLNSYLIMPIQRIPRYKLLLAELIKKTNDDHPDMTNINKALDVVSDVAKQINEAVRNAQNRNLILDLSASFTKDPEFVGPSRVFVMQGRLKKKCRREDKNFQFFLFNDLLAYADRATPVSKWKLHHKLDINKNFFFQDLPDTAECSNRFQIVTARKSFIVYSKKPEEKAEWLKALKDAIEERKKGIDTSTESSYIAPVWQQDHGRNSCEICEDNFTFFNRRHHCRKCGGLVCNDCSQARICLPGTKSQVRVCKKCVAELLKQQGGGGASDVYAQPSVPERPRTLSTSPPLPPRPNDGGGAALPSAFIAQKRASTSLSENNPLYGSAGPSPGQSVARPAAPPSGPGASANAPRAGPTASASSSSLPTLNEHDAHQEMCVAIYTFKPQANTQTMKQLSFHAGADIKLFDKQMDEWWTGECAGVRGIFPSSYVQEMPPGPRKKRQVVAAYEATNADEMSICVGDIIILKQEDDSWGLGERAGNVDGDEAIGSGWFPLNYTSEYTEPSEAKQHRRMGSAMPGQDGAIEEEDEDDEDSDPTAVVRHTYKAPTGSTKEMDLRKGDIIILLRSDAGAGWWKGVNPGTGERGWFPSNYVQQITGAGAAPPPAAPARGASKAGNPLANTAPSNKPPPPNSPQRHSDAPTAKPPSLPTAPTSPTLPSSAMPVKPPSAPPPAAKPTFAIKPPAGPPPAASSTSKPQVKAPPGPPPAAAVMSTPRAPPPSSPPAGPSGANAPPKAPPKAPPRSPANAMPTSGFGSPPPKPKPKPPPPSSGVVGVGGAKPPPAAPRQLPVATKSVAPPAPPGATRAPPAAAPAAAPAGGSGDGSGACSSYLPHLFKKGTCRTCFHKQEEHA